MATTSTESRAEVRTRLDRAFASQLFDLANALLDMPDPTLTWVGNKVAELANRALYLDARDGEDFDDRDEASRGGE